MIPIRVSNKIYDPREKKKKKKSWNWLDIELEKIKVIDLYLLDFDLTESEEEFVRDEIFVDPIIQETFGRYSGNDITTSYDRIIQVGFKPGMKDGEGERAKDTIEDLLNKKVEGGVYTATEYLLKGEFSQNEIDILSEQLLANDLIHRITQISLKDIREKEELLEEIPKVTSTHVPKVDTFSEDRLNEINKKRNLALSEEDIEAIKDYLGSESVLDRRKSIGLTGEITDVELELLAQTQSEHCKHKIFNAKIDYIDKETGKRENIDSLMDTYIKSSTKEIDRDWVLSTFWDNAGVVEFDDEHAVALKFETHNSPSAKEPYGGSITGIVGVYRDPMGTGMGTKILAGGYGFCTPDPFYEGSLEPEMAPRRLLQGIVEGVRDGGNKSGIPTITGYSKYDNCFLGKPLVYVGAIGMMPKEAGESKGWEKDVDDGDLIVTVGGRVGRDGIHGVTESSLEFGEHITSGHVQIGDPFTQKKVHDFLLEARSEELYRLVWDMGGGGLSSAVGETAEFSDGCVLELDKVPLKYSGLDPWEILVSESQERMLLGIKPELWDKLSKLARKHDVEIARIGRFTDSGRMHVKYEERTVAYMDLQFLHHGFPGYEMEAVWEGAEGDNPKISKDENPGETLRKILSRPNIASKNWIQRQYDHEVQGTSVVKPLVGEVDVRSDASVIKPKEESNKGLALGLGNCFKYSQIDTYWMAACSLDEALRRVVSVGANPQRIALNDNFCWPNSEYDPQNNPEGKRNLGKLVRAAKALYELTKEFSTPCISGKDSMFIDGNLPDGKGGTKKVSGIPALQFSALGRVDDVFDCIDLVPEREGDRIYILGETREELGASEYFEHLGYLGKNVPRLEDPELTRKIYFAVHEAIKNGLLSSCHGCYRGGLAVALAEKSIAGGLGLEVSLDEVPGEGLDSMEKILYSETPGRFLVTVKPDEEKEFKELLEDIPFGRIGRVEGDRLKLDMEKSERDIDLSIEELRKSYTATFGEF